MNPFDTIPQPASKPVADEFSFGSVLDDFYDFGTGVIDKWIDFERWDITKQYVEQQQQVNPYSGLPNSQQGQSLSLGGNNQLLTVALLVGGAILLVKAL